MITVTKELVGDRPAGSTPADSPIVQAAFDARDALGLTRDLGEGSTDANMPMSLGIPSITIGGGGRGTERARAWRGVRHDRFVEGDAARAAAHDRAGQIAHLGYRMDQCASACLRVFVMNETQHEVVFHLPKSRELDRGADARRRGARAASRPSSSRCAPPIAYTSTANGPASITGMKFSSVAIAKIADEQRIGGAAWDAAPERHRRVFPLRRAADFRDIGSRRTPGRSGRSARRRCAGRTPPRKWPTRTAAARARLLGASPSAAVATVRAPPRPGRPENIHTRVVPRSRIVARRALYSSSSRGVIGSPSRGRRLVPIHSGRPR